MSGLRGRRAAPALKSSVTPVQLGLFGNESPAFDERFSRAIRVELGAGAWVEHVPGWVSGHQTLFEHLRKTTRFRQERRQMYERIVDVPRLYAVLPEDGPGHPVLPRAAEALGRRYGQAFEHVSLALYRSGQDSVAWHGDRIARKLPDALVATVSLGAPRKFAMRPKGGGASRSWLLGFGDLFVMGGTCQRTFDHAVPKVARAAPRLSVMFRPVWEEPAG